MSHRLHKSTRDAQIMLGCYSLARILSGRFADGGGIGVGLWAGLAGCQVVLGWEERKQNKKGWVWMRRDTKDRISLPI